MKLFDILIGPSVQQLTAAELQGRLATSEPPVLLDVRTARSFAAGHIAGNCRSASPSSQNIKRVTSSFIAARATGYCNS